MKPCQGNLTLMDFFDDLNIVDGFNNKITMHAYANPDSNSNGAGYGIINFNKKSNEVTFECWPRFVDVSLENSKQFDGSPVTVSLD